MQPQFLKFCRLTPEIVKNAAEKFGTPFYLYDENTIVEKCRQVLAMPNAFGLTVHYAMKANPGKALLQLITAQGLNVDTSSLNEARRAFLAGIPYDRMILTTQEIPFGQDRTDLEKYIHAGLTYNVCSKRQLLLIADYAAAENVPLSMRIHPGVGSGESASRNTGDKYSSFGVHLTNIPEVLDTANARGIVINRVHVHIGSGGDPVTWRENIDRELMFLEKYFPDAETVNFGGGFKEARMPDEDAADIQALGEYATQRILEFYQRTGRKLHMEVEPGTFIVANAGFLVTRVLDKKRTGKDGFNFIILDAGMEANTRPLMYGSRHPFYVVSKDGQLLSHESEKRKNSDAFVLVGKCCESGDSQCLTKNGEIAPRLLTEPQLDDYVIIGGTGAYCSAMSPYNYNSHPQYTEVILRRNGDVQVIRKPQTMEQIVQNELPLEISQTNSTNKRQKINASYPIF
ncbi:diaminopimelate decarboxylase [candidate division KSB1 bacterium]|nr:diaminopimelate decarboxylase [candidate division KSB1 bacterium]